MYESTRIDIINWVKVNSNKLLLLSQQNIRGSETLLLLREKQKEECVELNGNRYTVCVKLTSDKCT